MGNTRKFTNNNLSKFSAKSIGENYVMNYSDFSDSATSFYGIASLANSPSGNAPDDNTGDFKVLRLGTNNEKYNTFLLSSPRLSSKLYIGYFWDGAWRGWMQLVTKSDLNAKTPTFQEQHMTAESQTLSSSSIATLWDSEITIPFDCIMIGNWKVLCKSSDANASFYYMVNNAYVQGRVQWDGTVQTDNAVNIFVMNKFTKGQKLDVSVEGNCSIQGANTSFTRYTFTFIPV